MRIVHKCQRCGHLDTAGWDPGDQPDGAPHGARHYAWPRKGCRQGCATCQPQCDWGPPQTSTTYMWPHEPDPKLYGPGDVHATIRLCGCQECRDLYAEVTDAER